MNSLSSDIVKVSDEVKEALAQGRPVVALESTIITHGMPYPQNLETAQRVEAVVRSEGCVPATVAVVAGVVRVGTPTDVLEALARSADANAKAGATPAEAVVKTSLRDLPFVLARGGHGGTTVAGTLAACDLAGVRVFVTGGVGGVHRGAEDSMDVSADLDAVARSSAGTAVVCAGVKSILDVGRTLEALETRGVPVATVGAREFPAFYTAASGFASPNSVSGPYEAACAAVAWGKLTRPARGAGASCELPLPIGARGGMLFAVPIPAEAEAASGAEIEAATRTAMAEAERGGVVGAKWTPFVLRRVAEITKGRSLEANIALVLNNAKVGSQIARNIAEIEARGGKGNSSNVRARL